MPKVVDETPLTRKQKVKIYSLGICTRLNWLLTINDINCGIPMLAWLGEFFSHCMSTLCLPKIWRRADVIAILKPNKPADDAKNYCPISLLCVPLKLLERLLLTRLEPVIDPQLQLQQAGFRCGRSTTNQVTPLTDNIEAGFEALKKVGVVLVDLTAAYDTVWLRGHLKLLRTITDGHMVFFIMELLSNRSFKLRTSGGQVSQLKRFCNGVLRDSILSLPQCSISTSATSCRQH